MKLSSIIKGTLAVTALAAAFVIAPVAPIAGAIWGAAAATTTAGAVGLGVLGFIAAGAVGTLASFVLGVPAMLYLGLKGAKAGAKALDKALAETPSTPSPFSSPAGTSLSNANNLKADFDALSKAATVDAPKAAAKEPAKKPRAPKA